VGENSACETLARVRKLARHTPALQFNIAADADSRLTSPNDLSLRFLATVYPDLTDPIGMPIKALGGKCILKLAQDHALRG